jgi:hypothetical protein
MPIMADKPRPVTREWTVEQKARVLTEACKLDGEQLSVVQHGYTALAKRHGATLDANGRTRPNCRRSSKVAIADIHSPASEVTTS